MSDRREMRQIKEAFIDGWLSHACADLGDDFRLRGRAERAWREENTTERDGKPSIRRADIRRVVNGASADQAELDAAIARLRAAL